MLHLTGGESDNSSKGVMGVCTEPPALLIMVCCLSVFNHPNNSANVKAIKYTVF